MGNHTNPQMIILIPAYTIFLVQWVIWHLIPANTISDGANSITNKEPVMTVNPDYPKNHQGKKT
jgi:hypothetical protein